MTIHMVTTTDNPHDPFVDFDSWFAFDEAAGYHTTAFVARVINSSSELSDADQSLAYELAVREIVRENVQGNYRLVAAEQGTIENDDDVALELAE